MKVSFVLLVILLQNYYSVLPDWNFATSVTDLLNNNEQKHKYTIDERINWYKSTNKLEKEIKRESNGQITMKNTYTQFWSDCSQNCDIFYGEVEFESIESFYGWVDGEASHPIICPKGTYNPYEVPENNQIKRIPDFSNTWITNSKYELKCYYHREDPFLVFYLMNGESYVLRLNKSTLYEFSRYKFGDEFEEIYDFKLQNREYRDKNLHSYYNNPYPFMALVKKDNYLQIVATKYDFNKTNQQNIYTNNKKLIPIKQYTQAYFNNFHFNNSFFYFTYNTIHDFTSGYSTVSVNNEEFVDYSKIDNVQWKNNLESPFEFADEVEIQR